MIIKDDGAYYQVYFRDGVTKNYIFVRVLDQVEPASTKRSVKISSINIPNPTNRPPPLPITFGKLSPNQYAYIPDYNHLNTLMAKLPIEHDAQAIQALQTEWRKVEKVELTKELDRTEIFFKELQDKVSDLEVVHEYGSLKKDSNPFSPCGQSRIDIALFRNPKQRQGKVYVAGAVMEMKTCTHGRLTPSNEAQTVFEMLKLGTDMAIKDKLTRGEDVDRVEVYGILVDMQLVSGLVMKLVMDFTSKTGTCYKNSKGTIDLDTAFQIIRERLVND